MLSAKCRIQYNDLIIFSSAKYYTFQDIDLSRQIPCSRRYPVMLMIGTCWQAGTSLLAGS